jgi:phosphate transport system substrate-binding protein
MLFTGVTASSKTTTIMGFKKNKTVLCLALFCLSLSACQQQGKVLSTPTSGEVKVVVDETLSLLIASHVSTFRSLYTKASVQATYRSEGLAFQDFLKDSASVIISARALNPQEQAFFKQLKIKPIVTKIAIDGIAIIVNNENTDSLLKRIELEAILEHKIQTWNQLDKKSGLGAIQLVFDNNNSSTVRYLKDSLNHGKDLPANCFATTSNEAVIEYVNQHKNSMGIIGVSWISDRNDPKTLSFLTKVKVMGLSGLQNSDQFYKPYQAYLQQGTYALCRSVFMINREARNGLGTGFVSFVAGEKGQRIILKAGLVPSTMPTRIVNFH